MNAAAPEFDLVVLTADKDAEFALRGLLSRPARLAMRPIRAHYLTQYPRDGGCFRTCHDLLRGHIRRAGHALVMLDWEGCGRETTQSRSSVETEIEERMKANGWDRRVAAVVIDPELESWVWSRSGRLSQELGWPVALGDLRDWLETQHFRLAEPTRKPERPKEAFRAVLRACQRKPSAAIFEDLAAKLPLEPCADEALAKLKTTLSGWFPV